jgi:hypothetical protein
MSLATTNNTHDIGGAQHSPAPVTLLAL